MNSEVRRRAGRSILRSAAPAASVGGALGAAVLFVSCSQPAGPIFETSEEPLRWPAAPERARIAYVGQIATDRDLNPGRNFGEMLLGVDDAQSMLSPYGVCTDGRDRLFVCDSNAQLVHVFDLRTRKYERWQGAADDAFAQPLGIAWDPRGRLLVADAAAGRVVVLDGDGRARGTIGAGALTRPCGIAVDAQTGLVFVADAAAHEVVVFDAEGRAVRRIGGRGAEPGRFNYPTNVVVDDRGRLYVADSLNFRVQVFDDAFRPIRQIGGQGDVPGSFSQPKGIAIDGDGHLYVVDAHFESVQIFDDEGRLLLSFGREGNEAGEFWLPAGIHIDSDNRIWVADSYNRRVQVYRYLPEEGDSR